MLTLPMTTSANHLQQKITSANCCQRLVNPPTTKLRESKDCDLENARNHSINYDLKVKYTTSRILTPRKLTTMLPASASTTSSKSRRGSLLPPNSLNKKTVVLDLDQTLVHSTFYLPADIPPRTNYDFRFRLGREVCCVRKRPFVNRFLKYLHQNNFEVVIFTAGKKDYASRVLDILDPKGWISHRLYRDSCKGENYIKDLSRLGRNLDNVVIVDDRRSSYELQPKNGIHIKPFSGDLKDDKLNKLMENFFHTCNKYNDLKDAVKHYHDKRTVVPGRLIVSGLWFYYL